MIGSTDRAGGRWRARWAVITAVAVVVVVVVVAVVLGLRGSGSGSASRSCDDGPVPDPLPQPAAQSRPVVTSAAGASYWDPNALGQSLSLAAYADGTVLLADGIGGYPGGEPQLSLGWVGPCVVAAAAERLMSVRDADFGIPAVADAPTALITVDTSATPGHAQLQIYALGHGDLRPGASGAAEARDTVTDALRDLQGVTGSTPWTPDRFRAQWSDGFTRMVGPEVTPWPLTTSIVELLGPNGCTEIPRSTAEILIKAHPEGSVVGQWTDLTKTTVVALSVLMPGEPACPPRPTPWR